jgi:hypothetical protein
LTGQTFIGAGIALFGGGTVTNQAGGRIISAGDGIIAYSTAISVFNSGNIAGTGGGFTLNGNANVSTGIALLAGGNITNAAAGVISGFSGVYLAAGGTVQNSNIIAGTKFGIYDLNGVSDIRNTGSISGAQDGILAFSASSYVYNSGSISASNAIFTLDGEAEFATGIALLSSATVSNASAGVITGRIAVGIEGTSGTASTIINAGLVDGNYLGISATDFVSLTNSHIIEALGTALVTDAAPPFAGPPFGGYPFAGIGVALSAGGNITNEAGATITGYDAGVYLIGGSGVERSVTNDGVIKALGGTFGTAYASGVAMVDGGEVTNLAEGTISGLFGVYLASGTVTNAGTITETGPAGAAVYIAGSGEIVDDPGAVFGGIVAFGAGGGLELAAGGAEGTLGGFGTQFLGFVAVTVDSAAVWDIAGATSLANYITLTNDGTLKETGADALTVSGALTGSGVITLDPTTLTLNGSVAAGQVISFTGSGDVLNLGDPSQFYGTIVGFGAGDTINLTGIGAGSVTGEVFANGVLSLETTQGTDEVTFGSDSGNIFTVASDGAGGTDLTEQTSGYTYTTLLGPPGTTGNVFLGLGVSDSGAVAGYDSAGGFIYSDGSYTIVSGPSGATNVSIQAISGSGEVAGNYTNGAGGSQGFIYNDGTYTTFLARPAWIHLLGRQRQRRSHRRI